MKKYIVNVNGQISEIQAYSAKQAITKMLRSVIGTRTAEKMLPLSITVRRQAILKTLGGE